MGKPTGFLEYERQDGAVVPVSERIKNFNEFHKQLPLSEQQVQASRCMECGVPFCQAGAMIAGMASGCPLHNLVPETNDLLYRGNFVEAYHRLSKTHSFPEFTSHVCPALCEHACTCNVNGQPVATKENERTIIEYAFENNLVQPEIPEIRTGKKVAVIGSGPAGLAAAQLLNRAGHLVTVYERNSMAGGLLRFGIPNMKIDKRIIDRRIKIMEESGITFIYNTNVGKDISGEELKKQYDAVVLCGGASNPRDIAAPGRDANGIYFAVDFLSEITKSLIANDYVFPTVNPVQGKNVIIIGGGDTGNDCAGTSVRLGAKSVTQIEMMPEPPKVRAANNPWPEWPRVLKTDYGQEECIEVFGQDPRIYQTTVTEYIKDEEGNLKAVKLVSLESKKDPKSGRMMMVPVEGTEREIPAEVVLIAAGFLGSEQYVVDTFAVETDARSNVKSAADGYSTSVPGVFAAGDMRRGQSLVVWAIAEGRKAAAEVDEFLMGYTCLN